MYNLWLVLSKLMEIILQNDYTKTNAKIVKPALSR